MKNKDEHYVLDLCDKILKSISSRQHRFEFLLGDFNAKGRASKLPVDAYYEELNLVIEYHERQHSEKVKFFDKVHIVTISGVNRGEQRRIYDRRRKEVLKSKGIDFLVISYADFNHDRQKKIIRNERGDVEVVKRLLIKYIK